MRAVIPGFIDYNFKDGLLPGHTKPTFIGYKILTVHNIISLDDILFVEKTCSVPLIISTIPTSSPVPGSTYEDCEDWLQTHDTSLYRTSF